MKWLSLVFAVALSACGRGSGDCVDVNSGSAWVQCDSLRFDATGARVVTLGVSGGRTIQATCAATATGNVVTLDVSGSACGSFGLNPAVASTQTDCVLPPLAEDTYSMTGNTTLMIPGDGGVGSCAP